MVWILVYFFSPTMSATGGEKSWNCLQAVPRSLLEPLWHKAIVTEG
jgi:hypothetical protein